MSTAGRDSEASRESLTRVPLLATKLHIPPARQNLVLRPRLLNSLTPGPGNRLILLSAPAGFGKTTLLSDWLVTHPWSAGWLSLGCISRTESTGVPSVWLSGQRQSLIVGAS
jgi:hypothetical protein